MHSIRNRLLGLTTLTLLAFGLAIVLTLDRAFYASALDAQEEKMKGFVYSLLGAVDLDEKGTLVFNESAIGDPLFLSANSDRGAAIYTDAGELLWHSPSFAGGASPSPKTLGVGEWVFSSSPFQLAFGALWESESGQPRKFALYVRESRAAFDRQLETYHRTVALWLLIAAAVLILLWRWVLAWGLRPLKRIARELQEMRKGRRAELSAAVPAEIVPLHDALQTLLRHERNQQKRYRNALDDLAHSLKTPLAAIRGVASDLEQVDQIKKILDHQVRRASIAGRTAFAPAIPLKQTVEKIISALSKVYREKNVQFTVSIDEEFELAIDEGDLMEIAGNLLENGCKWCRIRIVISGQRTLGGLTLTVEDDGPGFPKEGRERLLDRGVRADLLVPGEGIGLSVVQEIVSLYEGSITLGESAMGGGKVTVSLPL